MAKILLKAAVLLFIVFSVYFIVNPVACSNMMSGQQNAASSEAQDPQEGNGISENTETISSSGVISQDGAFVPYTPEGVIDTNTLLEQEPQPVYSQEDIDYAIASRYVELEREYARNKTVGKDASREISYVVMDDFEMSPTEWEGFLQRATASDLFNKVRQEMPPLEEETQQADTK